MARVNKDDYLDMIEICKQNVKGYSKIFKAKKYQDRIELLHKAYPELSRVSEILYWIDNEIEQHPICKICGNPTTYLNMTKGYTIYCSSRCPKLDPDVRDKYKKTCLEKYGVDSGLKLECIKKTNLERYGAENPFASEIIKERIRKTNLNKYGVENPMQNSLIQQKAQDTCFKKYGAKNFISSSLGREAFTKTMMEKYGVDHHWKNPEIHQKCFNTIAARYGGVGGGSQILREKAEQTKMRKTGYKHNWSDPNSRAKCENTCLDRYGTKHPILQHPAHGPSKGQLEVFNYIKTIFPGRVILDDRHLRTASGKIFELDIFIPDLNLAIEYDGDYWHSLPDMIARDEEKSALCVEKNIDLIRVKEGLWKSQSDLIKDLLLQEIKTKLCQN